MPIYAYACQSCGHELDAMQKMSDLPLTECPVCKEQTLKKQLTAASFRLGGTGWYETDFKKDQKKNIAGDSQPCAAAESGAGCGATDCAASQANTD